MADAKLNPWVYIGYHYIAVCFISIFVFRRCLLFHHSVTQYGPSSVLLRKQPTLHYTMIIPFQVPQLALLSKFTE